MFIVDTRGIAYVLDDVSRYQILIANQADTIRKLKNELTNSKGSAKRSNHKLDVCKTSRDAVAEGLYHWKNIANDLQEQLDWANLKLFVLNGHAD